MKYLGRKDIGIRLGGEKGRKADEFLTRSQLVPGNNIYFDYLANWDIRINAVAGGGGSAGSGLRNLIAYIVVGTPLPTDSKRTHLDLNSSLTTTNAAAKKYFGTTVFQDIYHCWNLPSKDHFAYSIEDLTETMLPHPAATVSLPNVVGVDENRIRLWTTKPVPNTRLDPEYWVDTDAGGMQGTRLANYAGSSLVERLPNSMMERPRFYKVSIVEVDDPKIEHDQTVVTIGV